MHAHPKISMLMQIFLLSQAGMLDDYITLEELIGVLGLETIFPLPVVSLIRTEYKAGPSSHISKRLSIRACQLIIYS